MDDTLHCPVCSAKMRSLNVDNVKGIPGTFTQRTCDGMNHLVQFNVGEGKVTLLMLSLNVKYSKFIEISFLHQKCWVHCMKNGKPDTIEIPKLIEPDFPHLTKLKERVSLYVTFS